MPRNIPGLLNSSATLPARSTAMMPPSPPRSTSLPLTTSVATEVVKGKLVERGGEGGIIAVDRAGNVALEFNSPGMFRGMRDSAGRREVAIYEK